jgi:hypothetical protein
MTTTKLIKMTPTLIVLAVLSYTIYASLSDATDVRTETSQAGSPPRNGASGSAEVGDGSSSTGVRDPFQETSRSATVVTAVSKPTDGPPPTAEPDPIAEIVEGLKLDATFIQGRDQIAIIDGHLYAQGQRLLIEDGASQSSPTLVVARVFPTKVILSAGGKYYELRYPDQFGPRPGDRSKPGSDPSPIAEPAELDGGYETMLLRSILDMALGKNQTGNSRSSTTPSSSRPTRARRTRAAISTSPGSP